MVGRLKFFRGFRRRIAGLPLNSVGRTSINLDPFAPPPPLPRSLKHMAVVTRFLQDVEGVMYGYGGDTKTVEGVIKRDGDPLPLVRVRSVKKPRRRLKGVQSIEDFIHRELLICTGIDGHVRFWPERSTTAAMMTTTIVPIWIITRSVAMRA